MSCRSALSLALGFACSLAPSFAQPAAPAPSAPSASASATVASPDRTRFDQLLKESREIEPNDAKRAVTLAREALALALAPRFPGRAGELLARSRLGEALRFTNQYDEARAVVDAGLALSIAPTERKERAYLLMTSAQVHWNRADYVPAEKDCVTAQHEAEALGDNHLMIRVISLRGIIARRQAQPDLAISHYQAGLALAGDTAEPELRAQLRNNLAIVLVDLGRIAEARPLLEENVRYRTAQNDRRGEANALVNLGSAEATAGNPTAALDYRQRALTLRQELGVPRHIMASHVSMAETLTALGRTDDALQHLRLAAPIAERLAVADVRRTLYNGFSATHAARGEFREALDYQKKAQKADTDAIGEETSRTITELRERFDAEKRSREIAQLRVDQELKTTALALKDAELRRSQQERYGLAALLVLGGITVTAVIGRQRAKARAEKIILDETRRARDAAEQATQLKSRLLDLASHDLKAPLIGVMLTADTLADETADRPAVAERAHALRHESQRMFNLMQALLDSSAAENGGLTLQRTPLDLAALAGDAVRTFTSRAEHKAQRITLSADAGDACRVQADAGRLRQALDNLIDNALKFSPRDTTIEVSVRGGKDTVRFSVRDAGPGLTAEDQSALFQRFRRLSATPTGGESSSGLGLALAHDLVLAHGGKLWAESTPGAGTTFIAEFPLWNRES